MSRPLAAGPSPLAGLSPRSGPSPRAGPSPLSMGVPGAHTHPSPRGPGSVTGPSPRAVSGPSPVVRARNLPTTPAGAGAATRPSPAALPGSPMAPSKRRDTIAGAGADRDPKRPRLAPGNAWIVGQVEVMQKQYKDALVTATMICQFQTDCKAIGYKCKPPQRLEVRLEAAWRNYNATRRQIEWFITQNHEYAADPIKFVARVRPPPIAPPPMPTPSPATIGPSSVPPHIAQPHMSMASPIPLSHAGFMGSRPEPVPPVNPEAVVAAGVAAATAAGMGVGVETGAGTATSFFPDTLDLSGIGMDELNALIGGTGAEFGAMAPPTGDQQPPQPQLPDFNLQMNADAGGAPMSAMTPNTAKLLETLNGQAQQPQGETQPPMGQQTPTQSTAPKGPTPPSEKEAAPGTITSGDAAAPASAGGAASDFGGFSFDGGEMDLSNIDLAALEGIFGGGPSVRDLSAFNILGNGNGNGNGDGGGEQTQDRPEEAAAQAGDVPGPSTDAPLPMQSTPVQQPQMASIPEAPTVPEPAPVSAPPATAPAPPEPALEPTLEPTLEPALEPTLEPTLEPALADTLALDADMGGAAGGDLVGNLDLDDFNFDDGSMPNVDGDEFASLFAEFK